MCNGDKLLPELKQSRDKSKELRCTVNSQCWCQQLETKLPHFDNVCLSPAEILEEHESILTPNDIDYLDTLSTREFMLS